MPAGRPLLGARTRVAGIIGEPVHHSLSPLLHNAAYRALGLDWAYVAFPVAPGRAAAAVEAMRALGLAGLSVTMPHKAAVLPVLDRLSGTAQRLGSVNTISRHGADLVGDSTDGAGLIDALRQDHGWEGAGQHCVVLGTGGAARAVAYALGQVGAATVGVVGRSADAAVECAALAGSSGVVVGIEAVEESDVIIDATPAGMPGRAALPFDLDPSRFGPGQLVVDLVYAPSRTPLLAAAAERGAATANGVGMLLHQAARQIAIWTGQPAPLREMAEALDDHISGANYTEAKEP